MSSNRFGEHFNITTFGESHGKAIGVVIDGVKPQLPIDVAGIQRELDRRRPGQSAVTTRRQERDQVQVLSGIFEGKSTGAPICLVVYNEDADPTAYEGIKDLFRPGHGDFTWLKKYGIRDWRGGGRLSGRETAARVAAGAVAKQFLATRGVVIHGYTTQIGPIQATHYDESVIEQNPVRAADAAAALKMVALIEEVKEKGLSIGGVVEVVVRGVPAGLGDPLFFKLDARLAWGLMSIGGVKGVEIGDGFALASATTLESNDALTLEGFSTNHAGGINGGISNGEAIRVRIAVKPPSSVAATQSTLDIAGNERLISVSGRHDPCLCPRMVPVAEAMVALVLVDAWLRQEAIQEAAVLPDALHQVIDRIDEEIQSLQAERAYIMERVAT